MIPLLFLVLFAEGAVALLLMVKIGPLRELAMRGVEQVKTGKGPATVKTLACTLSVILMSSVAAIVRIQNRGHKIGNVSPMDQPSNSSLLLAGYTLFLAFVIDRLHHYLQKLITLRKSANISREEVEKLQMENRSLREKEEKSASEMKKLQQDMAKLSEDMKKLKSESEDHQRKASDAEAHVNALQKQSEELLLEYDRLLEDNQILQSQLHYKG
ncbi:B-cell receptor-associated protein 31 [Hordeum vulgare]|nr:B-cell receptor-associated protein 31 [Hordeum vulgare]